MMPPQSESMSLDSRKIRPVDSDDRSTPRSVYAVDTWIRDDVSDLSGSYVSGLHSIKASVPGVIYQEASTTGPWRQAYVASRLPPPKSNARVVLSSPVRSRSALSARTNIDGSVEIVKKHSVDRVLETIGESRIPVTVLLMDGTKHTYELLRIWIDRDSDSVRNVVQDIQDGIPANKWKTSYDGIFQVRGSRFTQLIHILKMSKYDVQPNEILIAKPDSMTSKMTIAHGSSAIRHLTNIQVISTDDEDKRRRNKTPNGGPLLLSSAAQKRMYLPEGLSSNSESSSGQFLTFSPPFDVKFQTNALDQSLDEIQSTQGSNVSSVGMTSIQGQLVDELIASLRAKTRELAMLGKESKDPLLPPVEEPKHPIPPSVEGSENSSIKGSGEFVGIDILDTPEDQLQLHHHRPRRNNAVGVISQLNCFKTRRVAALACCPPLKEDRDARGPRRNLTSVEEHRTSHSSSGGFEVCSQPASGGDFEASMFYARRGDKHVRLMEI